MCVTDGLYKFKEILTHILQTFAIEVINFNFITMESSNKRYMFCALKLDFSPVMSMHDCIISKIVCTFLFRF